MPSDGVALDIACGTGANSFFLASLGMEVKAWDFSKTAIDTIKGLLTNGEKIYPEEILFQVLLSITISLTLFFVVTI